MRAAYIIYQSFIGFKYERKTKSETFKQYFYIQEKKPFMKAMVWQTSYIG